MPRSFLILILLLCGSAPLRAEIANTLHNFTPEGPGTKKNAEPVGLCRFCHTPHRASQTIALWNRDLSPQTYDLYESSTLDAAVGQPTGTSRLCLSCHDGTIALSDVNRHPESLSELGPVEGRVLLGTDLSDDHPISFVYDEGLVARNGELVPPSSLTGDVRLDRSGEVQCTSCHDPHSDRFPKFLVRSIENGELCTTCHAKHGWEGSSHASSSAQWNGQGEDPWPGSDFHTVGQNACLSCHDPHGAAQPERLLRRSPEEEVCLACHNANVARTDVEGQLGKSAHHPVLETSGVHDPEEDPSTMGRHVACMDCHNPHAVTDAPATPPMVTGRQRFVRGLDLAGIPKEHASYAYEVCFTCHGTVEAPSPRVVRLDHVTNVRLEVSSANPSYHPVVAVGTNPGAITLEPPLSASSQIYCHDCHNSDELDDPGPATPVGPHGSHFAPIARGAYPLVDFVEFDTASYGLCFSCHDAERLLDDANFLHKKHLEGEDAPCAACHDPHGSRTNTHLINFMRFDSSGREVVMPSRSTGMLEYQDLGEGQGQCFLYCHGEEHSPNRYRGNDEVD